MTTAPPVFAAIFADSCAALPPVMVQHYAHRPYSDDMSVVEGRLDIRCNPMLKPALWLSRTVPPYSQTDVPVTVQFASAPDSGAFHFNRVFHFKNRKPFHFRSSMTQRHGNEVIERMRYGLCWHAFYRWDGEKVTVRHKGYSWSVGRFSLPLPLTWIMGRGEAEEWPIDEAHFEMSARVLHPLFGKLYEYKGRFKIVQTLKS